jgi:hypothetical protein
MKAPNFKLQPPEKLQMPSSKNPRGKRLEFEAWNFSGAWMLDVGI